MMKTSLSKRKGFMSWSENFLVCCKNVPEQGKGLKMERETLGIQNVHSRTLKGVVVQLMN